MQCPRCQFENPDDNRFCERCAESLPLSCPACRHSNRPEAKFCGKCGAALKPAIETQATAPRDVRQAERRQLTVMFCDLVGSTELSERLDPEDLRDVLSAYQKTCAVVIDRYEGHIAKYIGDGLLVYFSYPHAHEDDARRAVHAGLDIVDAVARLSHGLQSEMSIELRVHLGIHTGLVVAGEMGAGEAREVLAIVGETPNIAARLEGLAEPNTVLISKSTRRLVEGLFVCDDLGPQHLKGLSKTMAVYRVRKQSEAPSRFEAAVRRGLTPLIGREPEIGLLVNRWAQAKDGESQVVLLSGDAGVGKSRIVRAFRDHLEGIPHNQILYYGSPYHRNSAFYPAIDQLERGLRFKKDDGPEEKLGKLEAVVTDLGLSVSDIVPVFTSLLTLPAGARYPLPAVSPQELKKKTLEALVAVIETMSVRDPVLMVVEDVHWIDPSTLEFLSLIIEKLQNARFLLVIAFRPEFEPPWDGQAHVTELTLNRLSRKESAAMVAKVVGGKALPNEILDQIVTKTDGVPLFVEELTKTMLESGVLEDTGDRFVLSGSLSPLAIPASLRDSLMARLDRLGPVKEVAQLAATIGRTFSFELLAAVSPLQEAKLEDTLAQLEEAELINRRGRAPDLTCEFKHALVRDEAYQSLLKSIRQHYHQRIAEALEQRFPKTVETQPELLAQHYTAAGRLEQAVAYWHRAGQRAVEHSANLEAIAHLTKGLELVEDLPNTRECSKKELGMRLTLATALLSIKGWAAPEVEQAYLRCHELCHQVGEVSQLFTVTWGLWLVCQQRGQLKQAQDLADEALALAKQQPDTALLLQAHHAAWTNLFRFPDFLACREHLDQGLALYSLNEHGSHAFVYGGHDPGVCCWNHAALTLWFLGYADQAQNMARNAMALAEALAHPFSLVLALTFSGFLRQFRREARLAQECVEAALALCSERGIGPQFAAAAKALRGWALATQGQTDEGIMDIQEGLQALRATGTEQRKSYLLALLAETYGKAEQADRGLAELAEALESAEQSGERTWEAELHRLKGELLLSRSADNQGQAEACFSQAITVAQKQSAKSLELRAATSFARLLQAQGKSKEAHELVQPIYGWFTEGFDTADLKDAKALLDQLR